MVGVVYLTALLRAVGVVEVVVVVDRIAVLAQRADAIDLQVRQIVLRAVVLTAQA